VVGQKAHGILHSQLRSGQGQAIDLGLLEREGVGEEPVGQRFEQVKVEINVCLVTGVLLGVGGGGPHQFPDIGPDPSRHGGVEVEHMSGHAGRIVKAHVGQLGVVVDSAHGRFDQPGHRFGHLGAESLGPVECAAGSGVSPEDIRRGHGLECGQPVG
jgi:hypothetical protein